MNMALKKLETGAVCSCLAGVLFCIFGIATAGATPSELPDPHAIAELNVVQCLTYVAISLCALCGALVFLMYKQTQATTALSELMKTRKCLLDEPDYIEARLHPKA